MDASQQQIIRASTAITAPLAVAGTALHGQQLKNNCYLQRAALKASRVDASEDDIGEGGFEVLLQLDYS